MSRLAIATVTTVAVMLAGAGCSSLPEPKHRKYTFPKNAWVGPPVPARPYEGLGLVRTKVDYTSLDPNREEDDLCKNYYNKAVVDLLKRAKEQGADAIIDIKTVVFFEDGRHATYDTPECSDDGGEGQVLAQAIAIRWKGDTTGVLKPEDFTGGARRPLKNPAPTEPQPEADQNPKIIRRKSGPPNGRPVLPTDPAAVGRY